MKIYFFGVWNANDSGHFWYAPGGKNKYFGPKDRDQPWGEQIDGGLLPPTDQNPNNKNLQGQAALHHLAGWTCLQWRDFTGDQRGGSNSSIMTEGVHTTEEMLRLGAEYFPAQMARQTAPIVCVSRPSELSYEAVVCWRCKRAGRRSVLPGGWSHDPPGWLRREKLLACSPGCAE